MKSILLLLLLCIFGSSSALLGNLFSHLFSRDKCPIKQFDPKDSAFTGVPLYAHVERFHPLLKTISTYAKDCQVKLQVKQAFIKEKPVMADAVLHEQSDLAFRLGEAIEFELVDDEKKLLCNRLCLEKDLSRLGGLPDAKCFLKKIADNRLLRRDIFHPTILMRKLLANETLSVLREKRKVLQSDLCKKLELN